MFKFLKMWIGIILLPLCWGSSQAVYSLYQLSNGSSEAHLSGWAFPIGFITWCALFFLLPRPTQIYVFGHELTHALWALIMGGRVGKMKVGKEGGHVEVSKSNFIITLAPYFFPFYTFIVIAIYAITGIWTDTQPYLDWWIGAIGFTWAFHITFTIHMLSQATQPDIQEHGIIFSYTVIYFINILLIGVWITTLNSPRFSEFGDLLIQKNRSTYLASFQRLESGVQWWKNKTVEKEKGK